jgi:hypothetical protein
MNKIFIEMVVCSGRWNLVKEKAKNIFYENYDESYYSKIELEIFISQRRWLYLDIK